MHIKQNVLCLFECCIFPLIRTFTSIDLQVENALFHFMHVSNYLADFGIRNSDLPPWLPSPPPSFISPSFSPPLPSFLKFSQPTHIIENQPRVSDSLMSSLFNGIDAV